MSKQPDVIDFGAFPSSLSNGMTMRDVAAIHFMAARLAHPSGTPTLSDYDMAVIAYQRADALLRARMVVPEDGGEG